MAKYTSRVAPIRRKKRVSRRVAGKSKRNKTQKKQKKRKCPSGKVSTKTLVRRARKTKRLKKRTKKVQERVELRKKRRATSRLKTCDLLNMYLRALTAAKERAPALTLSNGDIDLFQDAVKSVMMNATYRDSALLAVRFLAKLIVDAMKEKALYKLVESNRKSPKKLVDSVSTFWKDALVKDFAAQ